MAADGTAIGAAEKQDPQGKLSIEVENSRTAIAIRFAAVYGTLCVIGLLTLYLIAGAAGLLSEDQGTTWATAQSLARILFWPLLGSFVFLFLRPWLEDTLQQWLGGWREQKWYRPVTLVLVLAIGSLLGFEVASRVTAVSYARPAEVETKVDGAARDSAALILAKFEPAASSGANSLAAGTGTTSSGAGQTSQDGSGGSAGNQNGGDASAADMSSAVQTAVRSAIAAGIRSTANDDENGNDASNGEAENGDDTEEGKTVTEGLAAGDSKQAKLAAEAPQQAKLAPAAVNTAKLAADAATQAALAAGIDPARATELRGAIADKIEPAVADAMAAAQDFSIAQNDPRKLAEDWLSLCLMFVAFGPRELTNLLRQQSFGRQSIFGSAQPGLSLYLGVLFGFICFLRF